MSFVACANTSEKDYIHLEFLHLIVTFWIGISSQELFRTAFQQNLNCALQNLI